MILGRAIALLGLALPAFAQYAGPAILSRGEAPAAMSVPEIKFRPYLEVTGIYTTGLAGVAVSDSQGSPPDLSSYGVELAFGISGTHSWRHTKVGLSYGGSLSHYSQQSSFDSLSQSLLLGIQHQITRHVSLSIRENAGIFTQGFGLGGLQQTVPFDPAQSYIPTTTFFDNRTYYLSSQADLTIQKTARLSFDLGGDSFLTRYRSHALNGANGLSARGDMQYRVTRRSTVGFGYTFQHFTYTRLIGGTDAHGFFVSYSTALSAKTELSLSMGAFRVEQKSVQDVPIDPIIAALLGVSTTTEILHFQSWIPAWSGRLARTFRQGVAYVGGERTVTPGNGLFLASYATSVSAGYTYTGLRRWSFSAMGAYAWSKSVGNILGVYRNGYVGVSASRSLIRYMHLVAGYNVRTYGSPDFHNYNRFTQEARVGLGFAPGDVPLRIW